MPDLPVTEDTEILLQAKRVASASSGSNGNGNGHGSHTPPSGRVITSLSQAVEHFQLDAPTCPNCGHVAVRNGACYKCLNCGESLGCS